MAKCILSLSKTFTCNKSQKELLNAGEERIQNIIQSSKRRQDNVHLELEKQLNEDRTKPVLYHKDCASTYTSKCHISRYLKRIGASSPACQTPAKRSRRSDACSFNFREQCLFCGEECQISPDPKHPNRWRKVVICRTVNRPGTKSFKDIVLDACKLRSDELAKVVELRVRGAVSDLHAADARYHDDCRKSFMGSRNIEYASKGAESSEDEALQEIVTQMTLDKSKTWTSVELHSIYSKNGGILTRQSLIQRICDVLGDDVLVFSSPGLASIVLFRNHASSVLRLDEIEEFQANIPLEAVADQIVKECKAIDKSNSQYNIRINKQIALEESSSTLLKLLECVSVKLDHSLPALLICNMVTSVVRKSPTSLQIALGVQTREKSKVEVLYDFGVTCTYDELLRFKSSVAKSTINSNDANHANASLQPITDANEGLIQAVADNFDANVSSQNGLKSTHALALLMTQDSRSTLQRMCCESRETIERVSKKETKLPSLNIEVKHYQGPKRPGMPVEESKRSVMSLRLLAERAVAKCEATERDMGFMKDITSNTDTPEYGGYNTALVRANGQGLKPRTRVMYTPLIDMTPSDPDTMMTAMYRAQQITHQCGQSYTIFTSDQQLYRVMVNVLWVYPKVFPNFYPRLGGMHTLMSFVGCVGSLMCNSGLEDLLKAAFGGVPKMLSGKNFPQNVRALRMVAEEVLRDDLERTENYDELLSLLNEKAAQSRTTKLWLECLIKPVLIMMMFVRAEREGKWALHLTAVKAMMPYFFAAGHINYARYGLYYLRSMENLPEEVQAHFLAGEHVMRHQAGLWNGMWSDMYIETTFMRYGHGPGGLIGITLNEESLKRWALSLHACSRLLQDINHMTENESSLSVTKHKEEAKSRIAADCQDRMNIQKKLDTSIHPMKSSEHPKGIVNIVSGKICSDSVNVDNAVTAGNKQMEQFENSWPEGFNGTLNSRVVTMKCSKNSVKCGENTVFDTHLIYGRVIGLLSTGSVDMEDVMSHELSPVPTSMFGEDGEMRIATSKSTLKKKLQVIHSARTAMKPEVTIVDGCAILWCIHWPANGTVTSFLDGFWHYICMLLKTSHVYLVFDRYYPYSIKSGTRMSRASHQAVEHRLTPTTPLPRQSTVLTNTENKVQLIDLICEHLKEKAVSGTELKNKLMITGSSDIPMEIYMGIPIARSDIRTGHEEADVIIAQQAVNAVLDGTKSVKVICDDTDVFVLLAHFYWSMNLTATLLMEGTSGERTVIDIGATVTTHKTIMPSLLAAHALTGCDTVARLAGIGKITALKQLKKGMCLDKLGDCRSSINDVEKESTSFIASCYGKRGSSMSDVRYQVWLTKVGRKSVRKMPKLQNFPPTTEAFRENVKRAHIQTCIWKSALDADPPVLSATKFGWAKDTTMNVLAPVMVSGDKPRAPACVEKLVSCSCSSETPCATNKCGCSNANLTCTVFCKCHETQNCENRCTLEASEETDEDEVEVDDEVEADSDNDN